MMAIHLTLPVIQITLSIVLITSALAGIFNEKEAIRDDMVIVTIATIIALICSFILL